MNGPVLDCSIVCAWLLTDESVPEADSILDQVGASGAVAPGIWWAELRNVLIMAERRRRISPSETGVALAAVQALGVMLDHSAEGATVLRLARDYRISVYDALYLELPIREQRPLATLDRALGKAAESEQVRLLG